MRATRRLIFRNNNVTVISSSCAQHAEELRGEFLFFFFGVVKPVRDLPLKNYTSLAQVTFQHEVMLTSSSKILPFILTNPSLLLELPEHTKEVLLISQPQSSTQSISQKTRNGI